MEEIKINTKKWFYLFSGLHVALWTIIPTATWQNLFSDTMETIAWGNQWQLGYSKHPPLSCWVAALFSDAGPFINFQLFLGAALLTFISFWAVWKLANRILPPVQALISVMLLDATLYYNIFNVSITPDTMQFPCWGLTILTFYIALREKKLYQWLLVGLFCALSFYAKYQALLIYIPMALMCIFTEEGRENLKKPGIYLCGLLFLILITPHMIWSYENGFQEIAYAYRSTSDGGYTFFESILSSLNFAAAHLGFLSLFLLLSLTFLLAERKKGNKIGSFNKKFLLYMGLGPFFIAFISPLLTSEELVVRWGRPCFSLVGIIVMASIKPKITKKVFKRFLLLLIPIIIIISVSYSVYYGYWAANMNGNYRLWNYFPGEKIANKVTNIWHNKYHKKLKYIAGSHYLIVSICTYSKDKPIPFIDWSLKDSEWLNLEDFKKNGAMFTWWVTPTGGKSPLSEDKLESLKKTYPELKVLGNYKFQKVGIPDKDTRPYLRAFLHDHFPVIYKFMVKTGFFPDYPRYVIIGIGILPPENKN
ncbi:MAG: glycosyltransferase family 39 protein [Victivallales bacterium]|nr:glycosyltransferase family 39 protein [Victivallales bacterium]